MRTWKILFPGMLLGAALIAAVVHYGSNAFVPVGGDALAAHRIEHQPISAITDPIAPPADTRGVKVPDDEPWGPIRTVDW